MVDKINHFKGVLKTKDTHEERLSVIWGWVKCGNINFKQFKILLEYLDVVEEEKDIEHILENYALQLKNLGDLHE